MEKDIENILQIRSITNKISSEAHKARRRRRKNQKMKKKEEEEDEAEEKGESRRFRGKEI